MIAKIIASKLITGLLKTITITTLEHLAKRTENTLDDEIVQNVKDALK